jgi:Reverse transcriptase (RNA-dependent DNA polymerase)
VRSPSGRPAGTAVLEAKIKTLQAEIVKLEAVVAGQRADLERERHRANALGDELLKATLALPPSCRPAAALEGDRRGERGWRAWCAANGIVGGGWRHVPDFDRNVDLEPGPQPFIKRS